MDLLYEKILMLSIELVQNNHLKQLKIKVLQLGLLTLGSNQSIVRNLIWLCCSTNSAFNLTCLSSIYSQRW